MSLYYGPWEYSGGNGMRMAVDITTSRVYHSSTSVTFTLKFYTENQYRYDDLQSMSFGGGYISGSTNYNNTSGTNNSGGGLVLRATKTYTFNYPSTSYGSSPGTRAFSASVSGAYNGVTPSISRSVNIPARPYDAPAAPSNVNLTRPGDNTINATWTRNATSGEPYQSQQVAVRRLGRNGLEDWEYSTISGSGTSYTRSGGITDNAAYTFSIRALNSVGGSPFVGSDWVGTRPVAPSDVRAAITGDGATITVNWTDNAYDPPSPYTKRFTITRSVNGGAVTQVATGVSGTSWTDPSPGAGTNQYFVQVDINVPPGTPSYTSASNLVNTEVPPLAPTDLSPNGMTVDLDDDLTLTWTHNDGGDGAAQSHYSIEYSDDGGATWTALVTNVASTTSSHLIAGGTLPNSPTAYQWRVSTQGITSQPFGPWSTAATFTGTDKPVVVITAPGATSISFPLGVTWTFSQAQGLPQTYYIARLYAADGVTLLEEIQGSTSATRHVDFTYRPEDGRSYVIEVIARTTGNLSSDPATVTTTLELPAPAALAITPIFGECSGSVTLTLRSGEDTPIEPDYENLATNPSAEVDATGWATGFGTNAIARDLTRAWVGSASMKATWDGSAGALIHAISGLTIGVEYTATMKVWVPAGHPQVVATAYFLSNGDANTLYDQWQELSITFTPDSTSESIGIGTVSSTPFAGTTAWLDGLIVVEGSIAPDYFDGSTADLPDREYSWTGTPHASSSLSQSRLEVTATSAIVERRVDGGEWVTLATNLPLPTDFIDPLPNLTGTTEYRVTSVSDTPSYYVNPVVTVEGPDGLWKDGAQHWGYLSWGDGFSITLRIQDELDTKETTDRVRTVQPFLGRKKPVSLFGANTSRVVAISGSVFFEEECPRDDECEYASRAEEWNRAGLESTIVCWRDYTGRRIFGSVSPVAVDDGPRLGTAGISFSVTESDFIEQYLTEESV